MARFESHFIYLLRDRESMRLGENIFKVGKTRQGTERLRGYPKGSELLLMLQVPDCDQMERQILDEFTVQFVKRAERGAEYFEGDPMIMINRMLTHYSRVLPQLDFRRHRDTDAPEPKPSLPAAIKEAYCRRLPTAFEQMTARSRVRTTLVDDEIESYPNAKVKAMLRERGQTCAHDERPSERRARLRYLVYESYTLEELEAVRTARGLPGICEETAEDLYLRICLSYPR